jgi:ribosomal protein S18 acetylase RimI-like enzyme
LPQSIDYRGRGLGTVLLRSLIAYSQGQGFQDIQGHVFQADLENTPYLLRWYQQQGFQLLAANEHDPPELVASLRMSLTCTEAEAVPPSDASSSAE